MPSSSVGGLREDWKPRYGNDANERASVSIQILDIVVYSHAGQRRVLSLRLGSVNIITGLSKTGKSALIDIVGLLLWSWKVPGS